MSGSMIKVVLKSHIRDYELLVLGNEKATHPILAAAEDAVAFLKEHVQNWEGYSSASQELLPPDVPIGLCRDQIKSLIAHNVCILDVNS